MCCVECRGSCGVGCSGVGDVVDEGCISSDSGGEADSTVATRLPSGCRLSLYTVFSPILSMLMLSETMASVSSKQAWRIRAMRSSIGRTV